MDEALLRTLIRGMISEGVDVEGETLGNIRTAIDSMGEALDRNRADIIWHLRAKLELMGMRNLQLKADPESDWVDFREGLVRVIADLGVDWGDSRNLMGWASGVRPLASRHPPLASRRPPIPGASPDDPFQRWAFSPQRAGDVPREPNTALETRIIRALKGHFIRNVPVPGELVRTMIDLVDRGLYTDVLRKPEPGATLYRGLDADDDFIRSLGLDPDGDPSGRHDVRIRIETGRGGRSSSWSYDPAIAELFAGSGDFSTGGRWAVVLFAAADDNPGGFLDGESFLNNLSTFSGENRPMRDESECIGVGSILLSGVEISARI